jgi:hypothetical protein
MIIDKIMVFLKRILKNFLPYIIVHRHELNSLLKHIPSPDEPPVYNISGKRLKTIFLSDNQAREWPYCFVAGRYPKDILWDRNNFGLKNHVYSHKKILGTLGSPVKKFAIFIESETYVPNDYKIFEKYPNLFKEFELIFTHSSKLLDKYENAVMIPGGGVWYGGTYGGGILDPEQYKTKSKNISTIASNRIASEVHQFRLDIARYYKGGKTVDTYGPFDGGNLVKTADTLKDYRYSIVMENIIRPYYFTEKLLNCFASMTIPIYAGASKIAEFFNPDGILYLSSLNYDAVDKIVKNCNVKDYESRQSAIIDNYNRVQDYLCIEDYLWKKYHDHFI